MSSPRPTIAVVDLSAVRHNLDRVRGRLEPGQAVLSVVKADAYGHGAAEVSRTMERAGVGWFGVAIVEEGVRLREAGIGGRILVMGGILPTEARRVAEHRLTPAVYDADQAAELSRAAGALGVTVPVHLKVDTGMARLGVAPDRAGELATRIRGLSGLVLEGLMSHFVEEDLREELRAKDQIVKFQQALDAVNRSGPPPRYLHMANSGAVLTLKPPPLNLVRPGIMLYGYPPSPAVGRDAGLKPVLTLKTRLVSLRRVPAGTGIGYGHTFTAKRDSLIAVVPIGYADGYRRALSNRGRLLIGGRRVPVVGTVCMDMIMVDVTEVEGVRIGDEAVLIGAQGSEAVWADELAAQAGTNVYEVLTGIGPRVPRVYDPS
jgi:alanine racemase